MSTSTNELFDMLNWNNDIEIQKKGIEEAKKVKYISVFFQPVESKEVWENCARVIAAKKDEELARHLTKLFEWLQDMNWPGAETIFDRILAMSPEFICHAFSYSLKKAIQTDDDSWKESLRTFAKAKNLGLLLPEDQQDFLNQ